MSAFENSGASAHEPATSRSARLLSPSALASTLGHHSVSESPLQPLRASALAPAAIPPKKLRRLTSTMARLRGLDRIAARDHGTDVVPCSRQHHHDDVDDEKSQERKGADEMNGSRGLPTAEYPEQLRKRGIDGRRHGQSRQHNQRAKYEDHREVGEFLQCVVTLRSFTLWEAQPGVIGNFLRQVPEIGSRRQQIASEVATVKRVQRERCSVGDQKPGEKQMP